MQSELQRNHGYVMVRVRRHVFRSSHRPLVPSLQSNVRAAVNVSILNEKLGEQNDDANTYRHHDYNKRRQCVGKAFQ